MPETFTPESDAQLVDLVKWALVEKKRLSIEGHGSNSGFGYPCETDVTVSMQRLSGIVEYQPSELVLSVRAGTSRAELESALSHQSQYLAFEPPVLGGLYGRDGESGTLGGIFMGNLSGPRRFAAGAARDYLLGVRGISGRGEAWKSGGRVIKNVTGYDLSRLLAGSWGTLSLVTEITLKVLPAPQTSVSLLISTLAPRTALDLLNQLAGNPLQPTGLAFLPSAVVSSLDGAAEIAGGESLCVIRLEGSRTAVRERSRDLRTILLSDHTIIEIDETRSATLWAGIRDVQPLYRWPMILKLSVPPAEAAAIVEMLDRYSACRWYADAAGAWLWVGTEEHCAGELIGELRQRLRGTGSVVLFRATESRKRMLGIFSPVPVSLAALTRRIKYSFDPENILNPGRLVPA